MKFQVSETDRGIRLDKFLAAQCEGISRARLQAAIMEGSVTVAGVKGVPQKYKLKGSEEIEVNLQEAPVLPDQPEAIPLRIVYEDAFLLVLNKEAGLTVHPGAGQKTGTLLNALLHARPMLALLPRAGIVHRLDKETSGLMVVAKTEKTRLQLIEALKEHAVERVYVAVVEGVLLSGGSINLPLGRHPIDRKKMAVLEHHAQAKAAITHFRILEKFKNHTLIEARLETGRTHQIRVHFAHMGYPLVGDKVYGRKNQNLPFARQALQAVKLAFFHPESKLPMEFEVKRECDIAELIEVLYNRSV